MKQLLLRVPEELHARLTDQARASGTSVNALANQILGLGIDPSSLSRRDRLKLKLMVVGTVGRGRPHPKAELAPVRTPEEKAAILERALESMRGVGPIADEIMAYERGER
ncbi:hypothetical protein GCM10022239_10180 [Leifsonia bigeumensis]|uniref:Toxin-antitoxin system HicB family antitoxin n=1 Tax=Leifsonella bigeumensis TaxID=433643 RepID=A0ABP7FC98_9MICO